MRHPLTALGTLAVGAVLVLSPVAAQETPTAAETGSLNRADVENIIRDYLLSNPELLVEVQQALQQKREEDRKTAQRRTLEQAGDAIFNSASDGVIGNPDGAVTIVEFFDYNCSYCRGALSDMTALTEANDDLRFVLKEFPILGPDSVGAHVVSMALLSIAPDKYEAFHKALLGGDARASEDRAIAIAVDLGVDETALREAMDDPRIEKTFKSTGRLADRLGITGTPAYVIGDEVVSGARGVAYLNERIDAVRACNDDPARCG